MIFFQKTRRFIKITQFIHKELDPQICNVCKNKIIENIKIDKSIIFNQSEYCENCKKIIETYSPLLEKYNKELKNDFLK